MCGNLCSHSKQPLGAQLGYSRCSRVARRVFQPELSLSLVNPAAGKLLWAVPLGQGARYQGIFSSLLHCPRLFQIRGLALAESVLILAVEAVNNWCLELASNKQRLFTCPQFFS